MSTLQEALVKAGLSSAQRKEAEQDRQIWLQRMRTDTDRYLSLAQLKISRLEPKGAAGRAYNGMASGNPRLSGHTPGEQRMRQAAGSDYRRQFQGTKRHDKLT